MATKRKEPERKCIVTGDMKPKKELIRIVRTKEGEVFVDPTGKKNGRGAYVTKSIKVINQLKESDLLGKQLNVITDDSLYEELHSLVSMDQ